MIMRVRNALVIRLPVIPMVITISVIIFSPMGKPCIYDLYLPGSLPFQITDSYFFLMTPQALVILNHVNLKIKFTVYFFNLEVFIPLGKIIPKMASLIISIMIAAVPRIILGKRSGKSA